MTVTVFGYLILISIDFDSFPFVLVIVQGVAVFKTSSIKS